MSASGQNRIYCVRNRQPNFALFCGHSRRRHMARTSTRTSTAFSGWTWQAVLAGVFMSLTIQILLTMLGFGVGLLSVDVQTAGSVPQGAGWGAFVWWAVSGIIAAFVGGAIAAANSPD